ncbi:MAG: lipoprotein [Limnohabitans sp.]
MLTLLSACGLKGPLALPTQPEARDRATLPESLRPGAVTPASPAPAAPMAPAR